MAYAGFDFDPIDIGEIVTLSIDFTATLGTGETPVSSTWAASVAFDSYVFDPNASAIVTGSASIAGNVTTQKFQNLVAGCKYLITVSIMTSQGNTIDTYTHVPGNAPQ
jgi:hypothetical protein